MISLFIILINTLLINSVVKGDLYTFHELYGHLGVKTDPAESKKAVEALVKRLIGEEKSKLFILKINPQFRCFDRNMFWIKKKKRKNRIIIKGTTGVEVAWGFHHFLKEYCCSHISWDGDRINIPEELPMVDVQIIANDWFRYYQNICTTSFSFVWWDWKRWEREIDWMALNGFNLVLALNGQEEIWRRVYHKLGVTYKELCYYFTGPPFLCWSRLGKLRHWGGPLPNAWHKHDVILQRKILKRMREIGIIVILPAFAGHVPRAFKRLFPSADMTLRTSWSGFADSYCCPYLLAPEDSTYNKVASLFFNEYTAVYGTDHIYYIDPFNDITPNCEHRKCIKKVVRSIYDSINSTDPNAVWVMPSSTFLQTNYWTKKRTKSFLTSLPTGKILILDLQAEIKPQHQETDFFYGQTFIWCMLHNYGGTLGMHGSSESVNNNIFKVRQEKESKLTGVGMTPEGIGQNYVIYQLLMDMFWRKQPVNLTEWFSQYTTRRYGMYNKNIIEAWDLLKESVYNYTGKEEQHGDYTVVRHPQLNMKPDDIWYKEKLVYRAWKKLLLVSIEVPDIERLETYSFDLVDLSRQVLQLKINELFKKITHFFKDNDLKSLRSTSEKFLGLLDDMDQILATNSKFLLGKWINSAKTIGTQESEKRRYERNSRYQITLFGPNGENRDYASKQWSGLIRGYYKPRWNIFFSALIESLEKKTSFNQEIVSKKIFSDVEKKFTVDRSEYPDKPSGGTVVLSMQLMKKLRNLK